MTNPQPPRPSQQAINDARWFKATASANGGCVEIAHINDDWTGVRDTKRPGGPVNLFPADAFRALIEGAKAGRLDRH